MADAIQYAVELGARRQHLVTVTVTVPPDAPRGARLVLPTWTPGSYVERNYVHHVQRISATAADGTPVALPFDGHTAWRLPDGEGEVRVTLELYANELSVRTNHVDDHHALLIPPATFPYVEGTTERPHVVTIAATPGHRVWSLLPDGDAPDTFRADDYDHLVDSAFEVGDLPEATFEVAGVPHRFVWAGHSEAPDLDRIATDAAAIGEAAVELFGGDLPVDRYTYLCVGWHEGGGGLEHRDGSVLMVPVTTFPDPERYARFLALIAHEYLHLWNVKRLVPEALVRPDYERPTHSESLWVAEGWTAYYDELLALRAGCWDLERYLKVMADLVEAVLVTPGSLVQSVRQASHEAWTKQYVRDENTVNAGVDYYAHGAVLAWCLDLLLRGERPEGDGLDDALRSLWRRFGTNGGGFSERDVEAAVTDAAGTDLSWFFDQHVATAAAPPIEDDALLATVGLEWGPGEQPMVTPWLGVRTEEDDHGVTIAAVLRDGPAWHGGVTGGDRLLAIDGQRVLRGQLRHVLAAHAAGDTVELAVFRGPRLLRLPVTLEPPRPSRRLRAVAGPTERQREVFRRWTGHDLPERSA